MKLIDAEAWKLDLLLLHGTDERTAWIINRINHAPTVDAVPARHGRWLNERYGVKFDGHSYPFRKIGTCSECHETSCDAGDYCPNCGAKMDGREEE